MLRTYVLSLLAARRRPRLLPSPLANVGEVGLVRSAGL